MKKHNQYKNKITLYYGSEDMDLGDKKFVKNILNNRGWNAQLNMFLLVPKNIENRDWKLLLSVSESDLKHHKLVARPDIVAWQDNDNDDNHKHIFIEIDGKVHDSKSDIKRNQTYQDYEIQYLILHHSEYEKWKDQIIEAIKIK